MKRIFRVVLVLLAAAVLGAAGVYFYPVLMSFLHPFSPDKAPIRLVAIMPGTFVMGSGKGDFFRETPVHKVTLSKPFFMGATEVTQAQYEAVMGETPSRFKGDDFPVESVSRSDAVEFGRKLTEIEAEAGRLPDGMEYRLPTEAEWEYCCRAGNTGDFGSGDDESLLGEYAWFKDNSEGKAHPVGTRKPNSWGLYDMHGNVQEWCLDGYSEYLASVDAQIDPVLWKEGMAGILRGGDWGDEAGQCSSAWRNSDNSIHAFFFYGFRVVLAHADAANQVTLAARAYKEISALRRAAKNAPIALVAIPAGSFRMGSENGDGDETPVHRARIATAFCIGATEVTQSQYRALMGANPSRFRGDDLPVEQVTWSEAAEFCSKLTESERNEGNLPDGMVYRLPTEAEWEYCCRAGSASEYCFGGDANVLRDFAWLDSNSAGSTRPVGQKKPNAWGLYDMHGNVFEYCEDWYECRYLRECDGQADYFGPSTGTDTVLRGGSWNRDASFARSAFRSGCDPYAGMDSLGFRIVLGRDFVGEERRANERWKQEAMQNLRSQLVAIPPGTFSMGSETGCDDEKPVHLVTISRGFYIGAMEVTQAQYRAVMGENPSEYEGDNLPVEGMSWEEAVEFCRRLTEAERERGSLLDGMVYRLPTEAEWEYCCRAESTGDYYFGADGSLLGDYAWIEGNFGGKPHQVGSKKPNAWGLYDMYGNVGEWCQDLYSAYHFDPAPQVDPIGPARGDSRVARSSSCCLRGQYSSSSYRFEYETGYCFPDVGFRVVLGRDLIGEGCKAWKEALRQIKSNLIHISPGTFLVDFEKDPAKEKHTRKVSISREFQIGATEVTQSQFMAVMGVNPSRFIGDDLPIECVSWDDAVEFCRRLTESERKSGRLPRGQIYRLPTEAEWEYCCLAGSKAEHPWSTSEGTWDLLGNYAWFEGNSGGEPHRVASKMPNAWGLYDMIGNVSEWCQDYYAERPIEADDQVDPIGPAKGECRLMRGGDWHIKAASVRSDSRWRGLEFMGSVGEGFRVVLGPILVQP
ncbi:MAG: SUMF1/EgtB/PvdO family nonheme iron enzyme [Candidatus Brocadiia bacterium]